MRSYLQFLFLWQCSGSALISARIQILFRLRIRIQDFDDQKWLNFNTEKESNVLIKNGTFCYHLAPMKDIQATEDAFSPQ
jgi:hypothetical protein